MWWFLIFLDFFWTSNISDILRLCPAWLSSYLGHAERYGTKWTKERDKRTRRCKNTKCKQQIGNIEKLLEVQWGIRSTICKAKRPLFAIRAKGNIPQHPDIHGYHHKHCITSHSYHHLTCWLILVCQNLKNPHIWIIIYIANQQHHIWLLSQREMSLQVSNWQQQVTFERSFSSRGEQRFSKGRFCSRASAKIVQNLSF